MDAHSLRAFLIPYNNEGDVERMTRKAAVGFRSFDLTLEDAGRLHPLFVATQLIDRKLRDCSDRGAAGGTFQGRFNQAQSRWLGEPAFACIHREGDPEEAVRDFLSCVVGVEAVKLLAESRATVLDSGPIHSDDDLLLLDSNKIEMVWPKRDGPILTKKGKVRKRTMHIYYKPKQDRKRKDKVYCCLVERVKRSSQGLPPRVRKLSEDRLARRTYEVMESPRTGCSGRWTEAEGQAVLKRRRASTPEDQPEEIKSIALSLGRTHRREARA